MKRLFLTCIFVIASCNYSLGQLCPKQELWSAGGVYAYNTANCIWTGTQCNQGKVTNTVFLYASSITVGCCSTGTGCKCCAPSPIGQYDTGGEAVSVDWNNATERQQPTVYPVRDGDLVYLNTRRIAARQRDGTYYYYFLIEHQEYHQGRVGNEFPIRRHALRITGTIPAGTFEFIPKGSSLGDDITYNGVEFTLLRYGILN